MSGMTAGDSAGCGPAGTFAGGGQTPPGAIVLGVGCPGGGAVRPARGSPSVVTFVAAVVAAAGLFLLQDSGSTGRPAREGDPHLAGAAPARQAARTATTGAPRSAAAARTMPPPGVRPHPDPFGSAVESYVSSRHGIVLAAVYDLSTRQTWTLGKARPQDEASVVKLDILETLLARRAQDGTGLPAPERSLARRMMEDSDNTAATDLWHLAGGARGIGDFNAAAGLKDTTPSACVRCPGFPWPGWGLTTTTPADQVALLRQAVLPGPLLPPAERAYLLRLMENVTPSQRWGVSGGVPPQATVALKDGWLPLTASGTDWQVNSVGWVSGLGRDYLIAVITTRNPTERYGIGTIDGLSSLIWKRMRRS